MYTRIRQLVLLAGIAGGLGACEADRQLGPHSDAMLLAAGGNSTGAAPSNLVSTAMSHEAMILEWRDNSSNESGFELHRSTTGAAGTYTNFGNLAPGTTWLSMGGLTANTEYCHKIRSYVTRGRKTTFSAFSNTSCVTMPPLPLPSAPSNLTAKPYNSSSIEIGWTASSNPQNGFRVERASTADGPWETVSSVSPSSRSAGDWSRTPEQPMCYRVRALNQYGASDPSNVDCTTPPASPTNLTATVVGTTAIDLAWTDNSSVEDGYHVRRYESTGFWTLVTALPANTTSLRVQGLTPNTEYAYAVVAQKDGGYSDESNTTRAATAPENVPETPQFLVAQPSGSTSITVYWSSITSPNTTYRVERSSDGMGGWVTAGVSTGYGFSDSDRTPEQTSCYRVIALNSLGESAPSEVDCTAPPAAPTNLTTEMLDADWVKLTWVDNSAIEDGYEVIMTYWEWGCGWDECGYFQYFYSYSLPPNSTSHVYGAWETFWGVVAVKDGGSSDYATPAVAPTAANSSGALRSLPSGATRRERPRVPPSNRR